MIIFYNLQKYPGVESLLIFSDLEKQLNNNSSDLNDNSAPS
jgi:hypothetical protein